MRSLPPYLLLPYLLLPGLLLLAACGTDSLVGDVWRDTFGGRPRPAAVSDLATWGPEAPEAGEELSLALALGRRRTTATLVQAQGERRLWRTADGVVVATDGARVVATAGLRDTLAATRFDGPDPLESPAALVGREASLRRQVDLMRADRDPAGMRFGVPLDCRLRAERDADEVLVEERCRGPGLTFRNRFWTDAESGSVLRSEQWIGDGVPVLGVELLAAEPAAESS